MLGHAQITPLALAGFTGLAACTGTTPPTASPPRELGDYERSLSAQVTLPDVREAARRIHSPCRFSETAVGRFGCTDDQAGRLSEAASWLARLRRSEAVAEGTQPLVFEVFAAMEALEGVSPGDPVSKDPKSFAEKGVMDPGTAERVDVLRRRLLERAIERTAEETQAYLGGEKSCDLSRPYDPQADLLEAEKAPCTTTHLRNLLGALSTLLMADGASPLFRRIDPRSEEQKSEGDCARHEWAGGSHEAQLVPAFIGLSEKLDYWQVTCWQVTRMTSSATTTSPTTRATRTSPTVKPPK
jgi:hypothetical protein